MTIDTRTVQRFELELDTAHAQLAEGLLSPVVGEDAKVLAAAIALAGAEIALAIAHADGPGANGSG